MVENNAHPFMQKQGVGIVVPLPVGGPPGVTMSLNSLHLELLRLATTHAEYRQDILPLAKLARADGDVIQRLVKDVKDELKAIDRLDKEDAAILAKAKAKVKDKASEASYRKMEMASKAAQKHTEKTRKKLLKLLDDLKGAL